MIACDCKGIKNLEEAQEWSYNEYNLIFIGAVVQDGDENTYAMEIIELLKGDIVSKVVHGKARSSCSYYPPGTDGLWLVYVHYSSDRPIDINMCGLSRPFSWPYLFSEETPIPLPPPKSTSDTAVFTIDYTIKQQQLFENALTILKNEILELRIRRDG